MKNKKFFSAVFLLALAASCNPLVQSLPAGVIKSVDGGVDWQFANDTAAQKGALSTVNISRMDFDPQNRQIIYAGSYTDGLYKSEDSAVTWSKILSKISVYDFAVNPLDSKVIYAAGYYADHGRVLKTTDGGASWNQVYNEETSNTVRSIAVNPQNPNEVVIGTASGSVIKSADGGMTWQLATNFDDRINRVLWQNGNVYALLKTKGLFKSTGFADNFSDITASVNKFYNYTTQMFAANAIGSFNQVYIDFTTPSLIYLSTDKGLYKTTTEGQTWQLQNLPIKPDKADTRAIAVSRNSSNIVYTSIGSTIYKSLDGGGTWQTKGVSIAGFVNYLLDDPILPQIIYAGIYTAQ